MNTTLAIIKPDAVASKYTGMIIDCIEKNGFVIKNMKKITLSKKMAEDFYAIHNQQVWFAELVSFMISGPVVVIELFHTGDAIALWRQLMGTTNPANAACGTIRKMYAQDIGKNAVHGSDSVENAAREVAFFFN